MGVPYPDPVKFDYTKANDAIDALKGMIRLLQHQTSQRATKAADLKKDWEGPDADAYFQKDLPKAKTDAGTLVSRLQAEIKKIQGYIDAAHSLQKQHDKANTDYQNKHSPSSTPH